MFHLNLLPDVHYRAWLANQKQKSNSFAWGNGSVMTWPLLQWQVLLTVQSCSCLQQSRFGVALPVLSKVQPEVGKTTARLAKRLECSSAVSSRLCDTAHSVLQLQVAGCVTLPTARLNRGIDKITDWQQGSACLPSTKLTEVRVNHINQAIYFNQ
jgi:hypothetical protein